MSRTRSTARPTAGTTARTITRTRTSALPVALLLGLVATLAGCGGGETSADTTQADAIAVTDPWVKAADEGMTEAFAVLTSSSDQDVRVVELTFSAPARTFSGGQEEYRPSGEDDGATDGDS